MLNNLLTKLSIATMAIALTPLALPAESHSGASEHHEKAAGLLQQIEAVARDIREHSARVKTARFQPSLRSREWHDYQLNAMRVEANQLADFVSSFKDLRKHATDRQNKAFNVVVQESVEISKNLDAAIKVANERPSKMELAHSDYMEPIEAVNESADKVIAGVGLAESYGEIMDARKELSKL